MAQRLQETAHDINAPARRVATSATTRLVAQRLQETAHGINAPARRVATSATTRLVSGGGGGAAGKRTTKHVMVSNQHVDRIIGR